MKSEFPHPPPPESKPLGIGTPVLGGGVLDPHAVVSPAMVSKTGGGVGDPATGDPTEGPQARCPFVRLGCIAAAIVASLSVGACQAAPIDAPRALTKGNYMPLCLAFCQITTALTNHEAIASGTGSVTSSQAGTATGGAQSPSSTKQ